MAASRLASNLTEDYLTCSICYEVYTNPRRLLCDHSYCLTCILDYGRKCAGSGKLSCPICRNETSCPAETDFQMWIKTFPSDPLLAAILKTVQSHDKGDLISLTDDVDSGKERSAREDTNVCDKHSSKKDVCCFTHALLVCAECAWLDHSECQCFPSDNASGSHTDKINQIRDRLDKLSRRAMHLQELGEQTKEALDQSKTRSQASLREVQEVLQQFWSCAQYSVQHLAQSIHHGDRDVTNTLTSVSCIQEDLAHVSKSIDDIDKSGNRSNTLELLKESESRTLEYERDMNNITSALENTSTFNLEKNPELLQFCANFREIGKLQSETPDSKSFVFVDPVAGTIAQYPDVGAKSEKSMPDSAKRDSLTSDSSDVDVLCENISHRTIHVADNNPGIYTLPGVCIVGDHVVIVDQYNSLVMKFDPRTGRCVEKITILEPHHVTLIPGSHTILVTCWSQNEIYTVDVEPRLEVKGEPLKTSRHYIGIHVYDRHRMLVSALDKTIDVINFDGHVIHSIRPRYQTRVFHGIMGGSAILVPADLCMLSADCILVFDGVRKSLVAICLSGKILWTKHIDGLSGFTVFREIIYVCEGKSNVIMTLTKDGKTKDKHFLSRFIGIKRPWAIDVKDNLIVVTEDAPSGKFHMINLNAEVIECKA